MTRQIIQIDRKEFVRKVLAGERDFSRIEMYGSFNNSQTDIELLNSLNKYLSSQKLIDNPLILSDSRLGYLRGTFHMPYTIARRVYFRGLDIPNSNLVGCDFAEADFTLADTGQDDYHRGLSGVDFRGSNLIRANLFRQNCTGANFSYASLYETNLSQAVLTNANMTDTNFYRHWHRNQVPSVTMNALWDRRHIKIKK